MNERAMTVPKKEWLPIPDEIVLGVDIIELVSSSMYVDPLAAYREYVQNAADAIDEARERGLQSGTIRITIDSGARIVRIRDDGVGVPRRAFIRRLTAFGASEKRRQRRRGFRGVGRLAALGYCQELVFRSRADGEDTISELRWDCRVLRGLLRSEDFTGSLDDAVRRAASHREYTEKGNESFFEVEMLGVVRQGRDDLLDEECVRRYLAEMAPIPFDPSFGYGPELDSFMKNAGIRGEVSIFINGVGPLYRPHSTRIPMKEGLSSVVDRVEFVTVPGLNGETAACGWILHHDYLGAIPRTQGVRGIRFRSGNIQIGGEDVLAELFPEQRFNAWAIGEIHILDRAIVPNGRRDHYEQSVRFANVINHLGPVVRGVAAQCRSQSKHRQLLRTAQLLEQRAADGIAVVKQGALSAPARKSLVGEIRSTLARIGKVGTAPVLSGDERRELAARQQRLERQLDRALETGTGAAALENLSRMRRSAYEEVFSLIYTCATDSRGAKELIDRVLTRLPEVTGS